MNIPHNIKCLPVAALLTAAAFLIGCGHATRRAPELNRVPDAPAGPPDRGFLGKAADTTWNVVSAPVRWVAPGKKPVKTQPEPEHYESADLIIMGPGSSFPEPPPAASLPSATQPK